MLAFLLAFFTTWSFAQGKCSKVAFKGYKYQRSLGYKDFYVNPANGVSLIAACLPNTTYEQVVEKLKKESGPRNTNGDAVYFEFNEHGRFGRIYVVNRNPVQQFTFSVRRKNRPALAFTQTLVELNFKKSAVVFKDEAK